MNVILIIFLIFLPTFTFTLPSYGWYWYYKGRAECMPQKTPLNGQKWCNFTRAANEEGSRCKFKCRRGFVLKGPTENICKVFEHGKFGKFIPDQGKCLPRLYLKEGENGPFILYTQSRPKFQLGTNDKLQLITTTEASDTDNAFYIQKPGLNGEPGTVSFYLASKQTRYIAVQRSQLFVISSDLAQTSLGDWNDVATFRILDSLYYQGYAFFEAYLQPKMCIFANTTVVALKPSTKNFDISSFSFSWIISSPSGYIDHKDEEHR